MKLLYFAWVRQKLGKGEETLSLPPDIPTVKALAEYLATRGTAYSEVFGDLSRLRAAVNLTHVDFDTHVHDEDEVAFFPPVTGG